VERAHRLLEDDPDPLPADRPQPFLVEADEVDPISRRGGGRFRRVGGRSRRGGGALRGAQEHRPGLARPRHEAEGSECGDG
ncbi:hypothetical protein J8J17_25875, partial [Mycobacterium tuberculosis]|nr:hypothetical protein [Mycobacterium tuberculosis]